MLSYLSPYFPVLSVFILTYLLVLLFTKTGLGVYFTDAAGGKKLHHTPVPAIGGIAIFIGVVLTTAFFYPQFLTSESYFLIGLTLMFLLGVTDDFRPLGWKLKLILQVFIIVFTVIYADLRLETVMLNDRVFLMDYTFSVILSVLLLVAGTNAFNFIDGIDGLASLVFLTCIFGVLWFLTPFFNPFLYVVCASVFAFRLLNNAPAQIFLGDAGSLVLGFLCSMMLIVFCEADLSTTNFRLETYAQRLPVAIALFWYPIFDTLRVFAVRLMAGKSLFERDKRHSYSLLTRFGMGARSIGLLVFSFTLIQVFAAVYLVPLLGLIGFFSIQFLVWLGIHYYLHRLSNQYISSRSKLF